MTKHTPGPWEVIEDEGSFTKLCVWAPEESTDICEVGWTLLDTDPKGEERETIRANARLIAAAPEMLEAIHGAKETIQKLHEVKKILEIMPSGEAVDQAYEKLEDALYSLESLLESQGEE